MTAPFFLNRVKYTHSEGRVVHDCCRTIASEFVPSICCGFWYLVFPRAVSPWVQRSHTKHVLPLGKVLPTFPWAKGLVEPQLMNKPITNERPKLHATLLSRLAKWQAQVGQSSTNIGGIGGIATSHCDCIQTEPHSFNLL